MYCFSNDWTFQPVFRHNHRSSNTEERVKNTNLQIASQYHNRTLLIDLQGRLDTYGSGELQKALDAGLAARSAVCVVLDMTAVDYLSSASLRVLLASYKKLSADRGTLALAGVQSYGQQVIDMAGFGGTLPQFGSAAEALKFCESVVREKELLERWDEQETVSLPGGTMKILPAGKGEGAILVMGDVKDVLYSRVTPAHMRSKKFSETEYSIGLGGLGERLDDYFPIMGEMITIGGTMVWLPTDGHDTPDFLIPKADKGQVMLRTGFNVSIAGGFNELLVFDSADAKGTAISVLYRALFDLAARRRKDYKGVLGMAMIANMSEVYGSGIKKSPIKDFAPANGEMVVQPSNTKEWFDFDATPRHTNVTALICGVGADLTADLSRYESEQLNRVFYINPANTGGKTEMLHDHAVMFKPLPMPERAVNMDKEIRKVVEDGEFVDMRHLLDNSKVTRAFIGLSYIQAFRQDIPA